MDPNAHGLQLLQDIRILNNNLRMILCTGYPYFGYDLQSIAIDYCVTKSSDLRELKLRVKMALEHTASMGKPAFSGIQPTFKHWHHYN